MPSPLLLLVLASVAFALVFLLPMRRSARGPSKRDRRWRFGMALQSLAYVVVWTFWRNLAPAPQGVETALRWGGVALAWLSVWLAVEAVRTLGPQWSLEARLVEGHKLVVEGPYRWVRHPIYLAMLCLLVGTGANRSHWWALAAAVPVFLAGTSIRVEAEERLLREAFGEAFERYARQVGSLVPRHPYPR